jgi:N-acetyl sugar amidotransferase
MAKKEVVYCKRCVEASTRPLSIFDEEGICFPCRYADTFDEIDWVARHKELLDIADWARENSNGVYDCVIGVSGGKDSHRQAFYVRDELGLKPLLVSCAYPPEQTTDIGAANISNLVEHGFDIHVVAPAPITSKKMMRRSFLDHGNLFIATELALYGSAPLVAIAHQIPLIFLGENPVLNFGGWAGSFDGDALRQRDQNTLAGAQVQPWVDKGFPRNKLFWYAYPPEEDFERIGMKMFYLGYYMPDFNDVANTDFAVSKGLRIREGEDAKIENIGAINPAEALDEDFVHVNQMLKMIKHGFGKVTQHAAVRVRMGLMSREEGIDLVRRYDGACHERYIERLCDYMGITVEKFWDIAESYRNHDLWVKNNHDDWELRVKPH